MTESVSHGLMPCRSGEVPDLDRDVSDCALRGSSRRAPSLWVECRVWLHGLHRRKRAEMFPARVVALEGVVTQLLVS